MSDEKNAAVRAAIEAGECTLGIEFGSTRIKAVLIDAAGTPVATGKFQWENHLENGLWTYADEEIWNGLAGCYADLKANVAERYGVTLRKLSALGISAMMHGYLAFNAAGELLVPFRTWRNVNTTRAAILLTQRFGFNIPERWSIAHLYQAMLNNEEHVPQLASINTLAGYVHERLTGERVLSVGDASGMFPIDPATGTYDAAMAASFDEIVAERGLSWRLLDLLPKSLLAGTVAGHLTEAGAALLDRDGDLEPGCPLCPPEGDAGTGMVATNSVAVRTGNVSAGTSIFSMYVLEHPLAHVHHEIDMVTTPTGHPVAMVHCNTCTSDINAWVNLFLEFNELAGGKLDRDGAYDALFGVALEGDADCGGVVTSPCFSGEPVVAVESGRPLLARAQNAKFTLANLMRANLMSAVSALKIGTDILAEEGVGVDRLLGHGGYFAVPGVGQKLMAAAMDVPVTVMESEGEGGPWGVALLASYLKAAERGVSLEGYLANEVFADAATSTVEPDAVDVQGFKAYLEQYKRCVEVEKKAETVLP